MDLRPLGNVIVFVLLVLAFGQGSGGEAAPFKADKPCVLAIYDSTPAGVMQLDKDHPGQADILTSTADGSARKRVIDSKGEWRLIGKSDPEPTQDAQWVQDAYAAWKKSGASVPWLVGAGPSRGFNRAPPETQQEMGTLLAPLGVK